MKLAHRSVAYVNYYRAALNAGRLVARNCVMTIDDMIDHSDYELFTKVCSGSHSLHHLLPSYRTSDLRLRGHPFQLPDYYTDLHKKSFVVRSLSLTYLERLDVLHAESLELRRLKCDLTMMFRIIHGYCALDRSSFYIAQLLYAR